MMRQNRRSSIQAEVVTLMWNFSIACLLFLNTRTSANTEGVTGTTSCPAKYEFLPFNGAVYSTDENWKSRPFIDGRKMFIDGKILDWAGESDDVTSPIRSQETGERVVIGMPISIVQITNKDPYMFY